MPIDANREYRAAQQFDAAEENIVEGYATTFDQPYVMYRWEGVDYFEKVDRNAFASCDMTDCLMQYDHAGHVFARTKNGTLLLNVDDHGLHVRADLSKTEEGRKMFEEIKAGMVDQMSFAFSVEEDSYNDETRTRTILKIRKLYDVSAVSIPANPNTEISARSFVEGVLAKEAEESRAKAERERIDRDIPAMESSELEERLANNPSEYEAHKIREVLDQRKAAEDKKVEARKNAMNGKKINQKEERKMFEVDSKEYRIAWLKTLQGKPLDEEERAGYTQSSTYATNAIPTEVAGKFFEKMKKLAPMLSEITLFRAAGNLKFVAEGTRNAATSHVENSAITAAADTTVAVTLGAIEFMKVVGISKSAARMSVDDFENWIVDYLSGDIARAIDKYIVTDATHGITAITFTTGTNQIMAASTGMTYGDICDLIALLPAAYDPEAKFLVNKAVLYGDIANIVNSAGNPIFVPDPTVGLGRIMGYPVLVDDNVPSTADDIYLGKWSDIVGNLSEGVIVERDESSGFLSGTINYRGYASFDSAPAKTDAIVRLQVSST